MPRDEQSEFYVGYLPTAPPGIARRVRKTVLALIVGAVAVAATLVAFQGRFDRGTFEYLHYQDFEGILMAEPYPLLVAEESGTGRGHLLVAFGKRGAPADLDRLDGRRVRLEGSLIYNDGLRMIELVEGSVTDVGPAPAAPPSTVDLGIHTLTGEIVDSKCYLGVMKPGRQKPHRACAALCIRGGIPPLLRVETGSSEVAEMLLVDETGGPVNERVLDLVAEPVEMTGHLSRRGDRLIFASDPATYRRR